MYERYDGMLLPLLAEVGPVTVAERQNLVGDPRIALAVPRWLASAPWRMLVERRSIDGGRSRAYAVTELGLRTLA